MSRHRWVLAVALVMALTAMFVRFVWPGPFNYQPAGPVPYYERTLVPPEVVGYSKPSRLPGAGFTCGFGFSTPDPTHPVSLPIALMAISMALIACTRRVQRRKRARLG